MSDVRPGEGGDQPAARAAAAPDVSAAGEGVAGGHPAATEPAPAAGRDGAVAVDETRPAEPAEIHEPAATATADATAAPADVVVSMRGVSRAFGDRVVVRDIDLEVREGTILGVIGPSGSGKTTTIRMVTGALVPTKGDVTVLGERPVRFHRSTRERIGYMPQLFTLYQDLSARENVDFVASMFGLLWPRRRRRTKAVLKLLELWDARDRRASAMSGGMQRRLELACALVHEPTLLILDEPTAGIDPLLRVTIWEELHRLRDAGRTLLITTQLVSEAEECDVVALIAHGRLIAMAPPAELRHEAFGGDVIEVETTRVVDGSAIENVPGVIAVRQLGPREVRATVRDAATVLPLVVDAIGETGVEVASAQEIRPSFDEVFAALVERSAAELEANGETEEHAA
ncbi:MAG TPA: ABC transporter ATP-binding protein [Candidatus Limnocylindrales bacterium]|nr:ABC transporter ATP-binding protein [Candidatus Limnocylindrales bacterium]